MKCDRCEAELEAGLTRCPACGAEQETPAEEQSPVTGLFSAEEAPESPVAEALMAEEASAEEEITAEEEAQGEEGVPAAKTTKRYKVWRLILGAVAAAVFLAALAIVLLYAFGVDLRPRPNDINKKDVYTLEEDKALKAADKVVATIHGRQLTNDALQLYYRMQVIDFLNVNSSYLSYMSLDYTKPLSEQTCYFDESLNWEQYFVKVAIQTWQNYQTMYLLAMAEGFAPSEALQTSLEELPAGIEEMAKEAGFESGDAFIKDRFGATCSLDDYLDYCRHLYVGSEFVNITPTEEDLEAFYKNNETYFIDNEIDKDSGPLVSVRHILLTPEETQEAEKTEQPDATEAADATEGATDGEKVSYTEEAWAACLKEAEALLAQWKSGEATEESFAALANAHSQDGGSNTTGGLYTGISRTSSYVENFLNWAMDESRQVGDTGIVQTEFGYHIMYFANSEPQWHYYAHSYYLSERTDGLLADAKEQWPIKITYKNIALPAMEIR